MKSERTIILMVIVLFLLILLIYGRFNHMEQRMTWQKIEDLNLRLDSQIASIKNSEARYRSYTDDLKKIQERVDLMESEKNDFLAKQDNMSRDLEGLRASLAATDLDNSKKIVELGAISVKKQEKVKK